MSVTAKLNPPVVLPPPPPTVTLELDLETAKAVGTLLGNATRLVWDAAVESRGWNRNRANGDPLELDNPGDGHNLTADVYFALEEALTTHARSTR